ncbi:MAG: hypothetical protein IJK40_07410 [Clostridia bacterium]|nr:hypothetical protein [Clostridia bacterium]MBR0537961.1 hypothetical protein [Clostridia bacterium]
MELLRSGPDEYSDLGGTQLVESKVSEVVIMGGRWDKKAGMEYNFCAYRLCREAAGVHFCIGTDAHRLQALDPVGLLPQLEDIVR